MPPIDAYTYLKKAALYVENGDIITLSNDIMNSDRWGFEISIRPLHIQTKVPLLVLPTGDLIEVNP